MPISYPSSHSSTGSGRSIGARVSGESHKSCLFNFHKLHVDEIESITDVEPQMVTDQRGFVQESCQSFQSAIAVRRSK